MRSVSVLGSGVCGLAIGLKLLELDPTLSVELIESEDRVGGLARSLTLGGHVADMGPHRIHTELPDVQDFLEDIAGEDMARVTRRSRMWLRGKWIEYPPQPLEIMRLLGVGTLARIGTSVVGERAASILPRKAPVDSFESVMTKAFGSELYRLIVLGYTRKVWKVPPSRIHGDIARVRVSAGGLEQLIKRVFLPEKPGTETALKKFYYIPGGVEKLVDKMRDAFLAKGGTITVSTRVTGLKRLRTGDWRVMLEGPDGKAAARHSDFVFSTIPVTDLLEMLLTEKPDERVAKAKAGLRFIANFLVCVVVDRPRVTDCQWLYFPGEDTIFNRGYEPKNFSRSMGKASQSMMVLEVTCHPGDATWKMTDAELVRRTLEGLDRVGLVRPREVRETMVYRIPNTYPLYDLNYRRRLSVVWRYLAGFPGLLSVGRQGLFLHNNMDHSIHMGFRAASVAVQENPRHPEQVFYGEVRRFQKFRIVD